MVQHNVGVVLGAAHRAHVVHLCEARLTDREVAAWQKDDTLLLRKAHITLVVRLIAAVHLLYNKQARQQQ